MEQRMKVKDVQLVKTTMRQHQAVVDWYYHIVIYLLNRTDGLPVVVKDLIRERNMENCRKFGPPPKDENK